MRFKKLVALFLSLALLNILTACSLESSTEIPETSIYNSQNATNILASQEETSTYDPLEKISKEYDNVLVQADGYLIVKKYTETYNSAITEVGVVSSAGEWITPLSNKHIFVKAMDKEEHGYAITGQSKSLSYAYVGSGVFVATLGVEFKKPGISSYNIGDFYSNTDNGLGCYFYNVNNGKEWSFGATDISYYENGIMLAKNDDYMFSVDTKGHITQLNKETNGFDGYSEGLFFCESCFYDIEGRLQIDLSQYDLTYNEDYEFINGECDITFKNPAGTEYIVTIDKTGEFINEPQVYDKWAN